MDNEPTKVIIITGPTAVGKSSLGHRLGKNLGGEIINADSMQVYRGLDIGTAKPGPEERAEVPYHLIDIRDPDQSFQAADFRNLALEAISGLAARQKPVIVIGGTGLYLRVLHGVCSPARNRRRRSGRNGPIRLPGRARSSSGSV
ncbi:MAG: hypothetical protein EHM75_10760 [Desulfobacteraceae bacterium]|nr:MAG: hypothetical protein EHM75_10760 [Desulfobacteraceae bacterium]